MSIILIYRQITPKGLEILKRNPFLISSFIERELDTEIFPEKLTFLEKMWRLDLGNILLFLLFFVFGIFIIYQDIVTVGTSHERQKVTIVMSLVTLYAVYELFVRVRAVIPFFRILLKKNKGSIDAIWKQLSVEMSSVPEEVDLDKFWYGLQYLLTNSAWNSPPILSRAFCGKNLGEDIGYGPMQYLVSSEVKKISSALSTFTPNGLKNRFDVDIMNKKDIYPSPWSQDDLVYLLEYYEVMREYYLSAANKKNAMLITFT